MSDKDVSNNGWTEKHTMILNYVCSKTSLTKEQAISALHHFKGDYNKVIQHSTAADLVGIVMRQTTYTKEEAIEQLKKHNGEPVDVIREFMGVTPKEKKAPKTTNQMVFNEIRNFMDDVNNGYNLRKEYGERMKKMQEEYIKQQSQNVVVSEKEKND